MPGLDKVVYHGKLGSQGDRVRRVRAHRRRGSPARIGADAALADRAALLAKADLLTDMVGEFPELQGDHGRLLRGATTARRADVAAAIRDQYVNRRGDGDARPRNLVGEALVHRRPRRERWSASGASA